MRILLINPNTSEHVTDLVAGHVLRIAGDSADFVSVTARFGARYIASRAALAVAGHPALDASPSTSRGATRSISPASAIRGCTRCGKSRGC